MLRRPIDPRVTARYEKGILLGSVPDARSRSENRRPRAMFLSLLLGGLTVALTIGLLDVLVLHADAINSQKTVSAGVDLALGLLLLAIGGLVATGRLHGTSACSPQQLSPSPAP
jgi:hypothetical protein